MSVPRLYRRAVFIYAGTIVLPMAAFLWLCLRTLNEQRAVIDKRTTEVVEAQVEQRTRDAAREALDARDRSDSRPSALVQHAFMFEHGDLVSPARETNPIPTPPPPAFADAERLEQTDMAGALAIYRRLFDARLRGGVDPAAGSSLDLLDCQLPGVQHFPCRRAQADSSDVEGRITGPR